MASAMRQRVRNVRYDTKRAWFAEAFLHNILPGERVALRQIVVVWRPFVPVLRGQSTRPSGGHDTIEFRYSLYG